MRLHEKKDFEDLLISLMRPLIPCYSAGGARLKIGNSGATYGEKAIELEGFSRALWGLYPYWAGGGQNFPELEEICRRGLASGTDPDSPEYWGEPGDCDQCFVEMAAISCAMLAIPDRTTERLSAAEREHLAGWLNSINLHEVPDNNWLFFMILTNLALKKNGMPYSETRMKQGLDRIDSFYICDGWYADGKNGCIDYYNPWAFHDLGLLYALYGGDDDPVRAKKYRDRAVAFGRQFVYWFDRNGAAVPFGRSLTYRFAQCAFWSACVIAGAEPFPMSVMKGIISRNLNWWMEKPILDRDGILTIGYGYPQMFMTEFYNAPGSPYWAMKAFLILALPDDHIFWSLREEALPELKPLAVFRPANMLIQRLPDGQVNLYPSVTEKLHEMGQAKPKYGKFVYSSRFGFSVERSQETIGLAAPDSMLAFEIGGRIFVRGSQEKTEVENDRVISRWSPFPGIEVETVLVPGDGGHTRHHRVISEISCRAYDCGFALDKNDGSVGKKISGNKIVIENGHFRCLTEGNGIPVMIDAAPATSLYSVNTVIPAICYEIGTGENLLTTSVRAEAVQ